MCGIVGYIGTRDAVPILLKGLKRLEYRGYDSAGISVIDNKVQTVKSVGKIVNLSEKLQKNKIKGSIGIGHTRWATHGAPSDVNSHPHTSTNQLFTVVHNGILENYKEIKEKLVEEGYTFLSETDTEVISNYLDYDYKRTGNVLKTITNFQKESIGSFALGILFDNEKTLYAVKKQSPLVVGIGIGENFIASDVAAVLEYTQNYYILEENDIAIIKKEKVELFDINEKSIKKDVYVVDWDISAAEKGGFSHFMLKEIYEQPKAIQNTINPRIQDGQINLEIDINPNDIGKIHIVACGSAAHAGIVGKNILESLSRIPTEVVLASEFRYQNPIINKNDLVIAVSQSGETADTLAALRHAKSSGAKTMSIVNVLGSSIARESDYTMFTWAGPEIAVATTKAYSAQISLFYLIAIKFASLRNLIEKTEEIELLKEVLSLPEKVEIILKDTLDYIKKISKDYTKATSMFFIGRGMDYASVLEGSLKLKEISYIHSEAYAAGELKHGTISLIEKDTLVIACITQSHIIEKTLSNLQEVIARGAKTIIITTEGTELDEQSQIIYVPKTNDYFTPSLTAIPMQLFSYYVSVERGCDIDMPRNLAKSVTVE